MLQNSLYHFFTIKDILLRGGEGNRTPVQEYLSRGATCLANIFLSSPSLLLAGLMETSLIKDSSPLPQTREGDYPVSLTPTSHPTGEMGGTCLLFSRRKLIACWQLSFCQMFYESFGNLGMLLLD